MRIDIDEIITREDRFEIRADGEEFVLYRRELGENPDWDGIWYEEARDYICRSTTTDRVLFAVFAPEEDAPVELSDDENDLEARDAWFFVEIRRGGEPVWRQAEADNDAWTTSEIEVEKRDRAAKLLGEDREEWERFAAGIAGGRGEMEVVLRCETLECCPNDAWWQGQDSPESERTEDVCSFAFTVEDEGDNN